MARISALLLVLFSTILFPLNSSAASATKRQEATNFSTLTYKLGEGNLTFSLSAVQSTGDLYFYLSAPAKYQWIGVGTGSQMDGSVMWILYHSSDAKGLTLSPRLSTGEVEPSFSSDINCQLFNGSNLHNGIVTDSSNTLVYSANVHCRNVTMLGKNDGKISLSNSQQPFIYAAGPTDKSLSASDPAAGIRRHELYGKFWMDLTKASSVNTDGVTVPSGSALLATVNAGLDGQAKSDGDHIGPTHAVIMCGAFLLIFPSGVIVLRIFERVKLHAIVQGVGALAVLLGVGVGIYLSLMYNHSKHVSSGHQILGILLMLLVFFQWAIGLYHHLSYRKFQSPTVFGKIHLYSGPVIILGGIVNGFTGFNFSDSSKDNIFYGIVAAIIVVAVVGLLVWKRWSKAKPENSRTGYATFGQFHDGPYTGNESQAALVASSGAYGESFQLSAGRSESH